MRVLTVIVTVGLLAGCLDFSNGLCADGRVCPEGWACDDVNKLCIPPGCGDGIVRGAEQCDGTTIPTDCTGLGYYEPEGLACRTDCTYDVTGCSARCGDHTINGPEVCDGIPPASQSCVDYGYSIGRLDCSAACGPSIAACGVIGWRTALGGAPRALRAVWAAGPNDLFAVGLAGTILHSTGGAWLEMASGTGADLLGVWGSDASNVFAVGSGGTILHYDGATWSAMTSNTTVTLNAVAGTSASQVFAVGDAGTIARFDGASWTVRTEGTNVLFGITANAGLVLAVGKSGTALQYTGSTWSATNTQSSSNLNGVWSLGGGSAIAVGAAGTILTYNGSSWSPLSQSLTGRDLLSVWASSPSDVFIGGGYGVLLHWDGTTITLHDPGSTRSLNGVWGLAPDHVFAVTQGGTVQEYAGTRWVVEAAAASTVELTRVVRFATGRALAIGHGGVYTQFDGTRWTTPTKTISTANWLRSMWAKDESNVLIAGDDSSCCGASVYFGNYASGFQRVLTGGPLAVWGTGTGDLWAAGNGLQIWRATLTAPTAWTRVYGGGVSGTPDLRAFWGSSPTDIFVVGDTGTILHYDGVTWTTMPTTTTVQLDDIWGTAPDDVYAVGQQGTILHYNGTQWQRMTSGTAENLASISGVGPADIFIAATNNTILHFDGASWSRVEPSEFGDFRGVAASPTAYLFVGMSGASHRIERVCAAREVHCSDAWDDDCDGLVNCADPDCAGIGACARGGTCVREADLSCGADVRGSTYTGIGRIDDLRCVTRPLAGPEASYRFTATATGPVTVEISELTTADLDVSITGAFASTGSCDLAQCLGSTAVSGATKSLHFDATADQSYYIIVDGPRNVAGDFRMTVSCP